MASTNPAPHQFPPYHSFPPLYTPQPTPSTESSRLQKWSSLIQSYCRTQRIFRLVLIDALETPLFYNQTINRRLSLNDARDVLESMRKEGRAEWVKGRERGEAWVFWRTREEWAGAVYDWVDETAQKGSILTLYELHSGEATRSQEWYGMDQALLLEIVKTLVKRGKAQLFGQSEDEMGVKFL